MALIDKTTNKPWAPESRAAMFGHIRAACLIEIRKRDRERGISATGQVYAEDDEGHATVNRDLASKRSTGRTLRLLLARKWAEFCSEPRDESFFMEDRGLAVSAEARAAADAQTAIANDEVDDDLAASVVIPGLDDEDDVDSGESDDVVSGIVGDDVADVVSDDDGADLHDDAEFEPVANVRGKE